MINNNAPPQQPELKWHRKPSPPRNTEIWRSHNSRTIMSHMLVMYTTIRQSSLDRNTMLSSRSLTTCPHVDWHRCMKRPPPSKVMPRWIASSWSKRHAIERRRFAQQDNNTTPTKCCASEINRIITTTNLKNNKKNTYEMHIGTHAKPSTKNISQHTKNWPV